MSNFRKRLKRGVRTRRRSVRGTGGSGGAGIALWLWRRVAGLATAFVLLVLSPFVLIGAAWSRRRVDPLWVQHFIYLLFGAMVLTGTLLFMTNTRAERALRLFSDFSQIKVNVREVPYESLINKHAIAEGIDPSLVAAVIKNESGFRPDAVSRAGARGLMQLMPATWREARPKASCDGEHAPPATGADCIYDPEANIAAGTAHLKTLLDYFEGDVVLALAAYNAGAGAVSQYRTAGAKGGVPPFPETQGYTARVADTWARWRHGVTVWQLLLVRSLRRVTALCFAVSIVLWGIFVVWMNRSLLRHL